MKRSSTEETPFPSLGMLQDLPLIVGRPFLGGGFGALFDELEIDPDEVSKEQSKENRPDYDPEKIIMAWRIPVDSLVVHVPSFLFILYAAP